jgi:hypothetical protein
MQPLPWPHDWVVKGSWHFLWGIDSGFNDQEVFHDLPEILQSPYQVLAVLDEAERQRDIKSAHNARVQVVNGHTAKLDT